jgi:phosphopentomutase
VSESNPITSNRDGMEKTIAIARSPGAGFVFTNLVDFDMKFGHRRDVAGYAAALEEFDAQLGAFLPLLRPDELVLVTADHGCDPIFKGTDHTREYIPLLAAGPAVKAGSLGTRASFADIGATVAELLLGPAAAAALPRGRSFAGEIE